MKIINLKSSRRLHGFTLVELLLVLVILAILAAIVLPSMASRGGEARETAAKVDVANMTTALNVFEVDNGYYPKGANALEALIVKPREAAHWKGPYLQKNKIPIDPWGRPYVYESPGKHNPASFDLYSAGKDGKSWIGNWDN